MWSPVDWPGFGDIALAALLFLCVTAFVAGAVDAIVGGGGLLQLPAMLLVNPGGAVVYSLATSKMAGLVGRRPPRSPSGGGRRWTGAP